MAKAKKAAKKAAIKKDKPLAVNGSFLDIMKAAGKHANNKSAKKAS